MSHCTTFDRQYRLQAAGYAKQRDTQGMRGSRAGQSVGNVMRAQQVELNVGNTQRAVQIKRRATARIAGQIARVKVCVRIGQGETEYLAASSPGLPDAKSLVVQIEDGDAICVQSFENLALGLDDFFRPAELANVGGPGIIEHGNMGFGHADGVSDFTQTRSTQFNHCRGVFLGQLKQGQRHAQVIIQVAFGRQHRTTGTQDAGEHFFNGGLATGTGDGGNRLVVTGTIERTQLAQCNACILDHQLRQSRLRYFALDQGRDRAFGSHFIQIVMTIKTRAGQGDKQLTLADRTTVDADTVETAIGRNQPAIQRIGYFAQQ